MNVAWRTAVVVLVLSAALAGMIAKKQYTLTTGTPVLLETRPIDPRSLFRGDYVRLNYAISTLRPDELAGDDDFRRNDTIFVVLQKADSYWQPVAVHRQRPQAADGLVTIRGRVTAAGVASRDPATRSPGDFPTLTVSYGIENYFVPEGEGRALERPSAEQRVDLRIAVDRFGNAAIQAVLVNGRERYVESLL
jgi:uncharacterized membrane-anchored protein